MIEIRITKPAMTILSKGSRSLCAALLLSAAALAATAFGPGTAGTAQAQSVLENVTREGADGGGASRERPHEQERIDRIRREAENGPEAMPAQPAETASDQMEAAEGEAAAEDLPLAEQVDEDIAIEGGPKTIVVIGDFTAGALADGLSDLFSDQPELTIDNRANGSSGLVRDDYYDWPEQLRRIVSGEAGSPPDMVAVMIGANDRQELRVGGNTLAVRSEGWNEEYRSRVDEIAKIVSDAQIPLVWVGQTSFRFDSMTTDMLAFNDIYRRAAEAVGGAYVDVWDGFVNESGKFAYSGPNVLGQNVRLRTEDGIRMTGAGARKLAFYAQKPIEDLLQTSARPETRVAPTESEAESGLVGPVEGEAGRGDAPLVSRTRAFRLDDPELDGPNVLLGGDSTAPMDGPPDANSGSERITTGLPPFGPAGRVDHFGAASRLPEGVEAIDGGGRSLLRPTRSAEEIDPGVESEAPAPDDAASAGQDAAPAG